MRKRTAELEQQIQSLKDERAELYKTQGMNAQRLLDVNDVLRNHEETAKKNKEEIQKLTEANQTLTNKVDLQVQVLREKDVTIQLLQDEVATLQLELGKIDERMKDLEKENGQLLQRWLKKMNEEAERMNEANIALEVHAKALEFQSGVVIVDKEFTPKPITHTESGIGTTLVSGHLDNNLRFWDVRSGKDIKELTGIHLGQITSVSVSPGKQIFQH
ncbi:8467_t:CDS:2 [Racocetra fulgida]|uniref:8467_t:CDS:1 n=1 Tax=Racocetra fulgida TaxID=60492 RepID=A0A9N8WLZ3_9GLOM|nr:8467_t:CDS:2 [Racocetra fulgida]